MEHTRNSETFAVLLRFLRRYWRIPAQVAGVLVMLAVLLLALPFLPRFHGRVEAMSDSPSGGNRGAVESLYSKGVGSPFAGLVASTAVNEGQSVKKGDLLFKMDITQLQSQ
ncbi:MAG: biotin/lipoyl-binding protein, partial [Actinomycetota bacterium]